MGAATKGPTRNGAGAGPCAVLWDLDGTLLDSKLSIRDTMNTVLAERGLPVFTRDELDALIGHPLRDILATKTKDRAVVEAMTHRYRAAYNESGWVTVRVAEGLLPLLERLRQDGVRTAVVTSKGRRPRCFSPTSASRTCSTPWWVTTTSVR
jgi:phosphoglycolate phosphatase-like HAD superfamily hydrolase